MIRVVIFDLDGTLIDSLTDLYLTMNRSMEHFGFPPQPDKDYPRRALGEGSREYLKACLPAEKRGDEDLVDRCLDQYRKFYVDNPCENTVPYEGICEVLSFLQEKGISINVLSNKPDVPTKNFVKSRFPDFTFDFVYGDRPGIPRKPDPYVALEIAESLGILPEEVVFVGDSEADARTGQAAGMHVISALWGYRTEEELKTCGATLFAKTPQDVIQLIKDLS